jgi:hypothetical protein
MYVTGSNVYVDLGPRDRDKENQLPHKSSKQLFSHCRRNIPDIFPAQSVHTKVTSSGKRGV